MVHIRDDVFHFLHYDPRRQRLFGLRNVSTFTLIIEEYNITTLDVVKEYTREVGEQYAFQYELTGDSLVGRTSPLE